jgi:hypothetical protein
MTIIFYFNMQIVVGAVRRSAPTQTDRFFISVFRLKGAARRSAPPTVCNIAFEGAIKSACACKYILLGWRFLAYF